MPAQSAASKRKRDPHDIGTGQTSESPRRSSFKRVSPNTAQSLPDYSAQIVNDLQAAANASIDFGNLAHHNGEGSSHAMNGSEHSQASTAAAALAYTLGQQHDMAYSHGPDDKNLDPALSMVESDTSNIQDSSYSDKPQGLHTTPSRDGGPKPQVGSEEWHKLRRDNHKEGLCERYRIEH